ncbi:hypothetical protein PM8797T_23119 [Gimesia maris DSM 8797]|nr:hypothetical protein PM8797T_23119 [Gimesia maris DSM 8797]
MAEVDFLLRLMTWFPETQPVTKGDVPVCGYTEGAFQLSEGQGNPYENLDQ